MAQDLVNSLKFSRLSLAATITASTTVATKIDLSGYQGAVAFLLNLGAITADADNTLTFEVWESEDNAVADPYVKITDPYRFITPRNVTAANPHGTGEFVVDSTTLANTDQIFGVLAGVKRYMEVRMIEAGIVSVVVTLNLLKGGARSTPVNG